MRTVANVLLLVGLGWLCGLVFPREGLAVLGVALAAVAIFLAGRENRL